MSHEKRPPPLPRTEPSMHLVREEMPPQPTTKQIPAVQSTQDAILRELRALRGDVGLLDGQVQVLGQEFSLMKQELVEVRSRNSDRAKHGSQHDMEQDAAIAQVVQKVDAIEKKTDAQTVMLTKAAGFMKDPKVVFVGMLLYGVIRSVAAKHGVDLP